MNKSLLLMVMAFCVGLATVFWARMLAGGLPWPVYLYDSGRLLALLAFILVTFQYVLSSRIKWIEKGIGLDKLFAIHKRSGGVILVIATAHPLMLLLSERLQGYATPWGFLKILGLITLLLIWVAAGVALLRNKIRLEYKTWKKVHQLGYAILPLAFWHSFFIGSTLQQDSMRAFWGVLAIIYLAIIANKIRRRYAVKRHPTK
jgi:predicted ferric reductase